MKELNTPKKEKICAIFHDYLGLDKNRKRCLNYKWNK